MEVMRGRRASVASESAARRQRGRQGTLTQQPFSSRSASGRKSSYQRMPPNCPVWLQAGCACLLVIFLSGSGSAGDTKKGAKLPQPATLDAQTPLSFDFLPSDAPGGFDIHLHGVDRLAFSRDGLALVTTSASENTIRWWNVRTGEQVGMAPCRERFYVLCMDGRYLVFRDDEANITIRDLDTNRQRTLSLKLKNHWVYAKLSPDGTRLVIHAGNTVRKGDHVTTEWEKTIRVWDTVKDKQTALIPDPKQESGGMFFSPDGKLLAIDNYKSIRILNVANGNKCADIPVSSGQMMAFSQGALFIALTTYPSSTVQFWEVSSGKKRKTVELPSTVDDLASSPDGSLIAVRCEDHCIRILDPVKKVVCFTLGRHKNKIIGGSMSFSRDGKLLASTAGFPLTQNEYEEVKIWSIKDKKELSTLRERYPYVGAMRFSRDGSELVLWNRDLLDPENRADIQVWDVAGCKLKSSTCGPKGAGCLALLMSDGGTVLEATPSNCIRFWDIASGQVGFVSKPIGRDLHCLADSLDGKTVAAGTFNDGQVSLWDYPKKDITKARLLKTLDGQANGVTRVALSPAAKLLATGGSDSSVILRDLKDGSVKHLAENQFGGTHVTALSFSPDGKLLAWGDSVGCLFQYDTTTGKTEGGGLIHQRWISSISYSPDGKLFASASLDRTVKIMESRDEKRICQTLKGHTRGVYQCVFSPDSKILATAAWDGTVRLWNVINGKSLGIFDFAR